MYLRPFLSILCILSVLQVHSQVWDFVGIDFSDADKRAFANKDADLDDLQGLVYNLTKDLKTDVEKFRSIFMWVCNNVKNDYGLYAKNKQKRRKYQDDSLKLEAWNDKFKKRIFKTLLRRKRTICTGYAYVVQTLSQLANIDCKIIDGFGKTSSDIIDDFKYANHSWNAVKLNGKWYLCDPTWASGVQDINNGRFVFNYNDGLFLASPELFAVNHFPLDKQWFLIKGQNPSFKQFMEAPILYNEAYNFLKTHILPEKFYNEVPQNYKIDFEYNLKPNVTPQKIVLLIDDGTNSKTVRPDKTTFENQKLKLSYILKKRGYYDIHIKIDGQLIATYVFKVVRFNNN